MNMVEVTIRIPEETWEYCKRAAASEGNRRAPETYVAELVMMARGMVGIGNFFLTLFGGHSATKVQTVSREANNQTVPPLLSGGTETPDHE